MFGFVGIPSVALHKKSWAVIDRPYSLGFAAVGALYERPRCIFCAKPSLRKARQSGVCSEPKPLTSGGLSFVILTAGRHEETKDATKENRVCVLPAPLSLLWDWSCPPKQKKSGAGVFPEASAAARIPAVR